MLDVLIIGAGPAGLTVATYLGRFHRPTLVIAGGTSRAQWIPQSRNIPGFPMGIGGSDFLAQLRRQALQYGAEIRTGWVQSLERTARGFTVRWSEGAIECRYVTLATGVRDRLPPLEGAAEALACGLLRVCPICDGYEATGRSIGVIGDDAHGAREAEFLRTFSDRVTLIHVGGPLAPEIRDRLAVCQVALMNTSLDQLRIESGGLRVRCEAGCDNAKAEGGSRLFEVFYAALGCSPQTELARSVGANCDQGGAVLVDNHQRTSVEGLYAAGDLVRGLNQVVVAAAEAAIVATDIHNRLRIAEAALLPEGQ